MGWCYSHVRPIDERHCRSPKTTNDSLGVAFLLITYYGLIITLQSQLSQRPDRTRLTDFQRGCRATHPHR